MFHWQNIVSRNQTTSRYRVSYVIHPFCTLHSREIHVLNRWTGWLWWEFGHLLCVKDTDDIIKQKNKEPWKHTKQIFPEQRTKKSFALHHLCPVHEVLTGIWNPLISAQIVNSFGQGKCTFDFQSGNLKTMPLATMSQQAHAFWELKHWSPSTLLVCGHFIQIQSCMSISFSFMYTNNYKHFHKWFGIFYSDDSVLARVPHIQWSWVMTTFIVLLNCILNDIARDQAPQWGKKEKKGVK